MKCLCPKCAASIELDLPDIQDDQAQAKCPECKARLYVARESFSARALRRAGEISCTGCGEMLDHTIQCPGCKTLFPDYLAVQDKKIRRQSTKTGLLDSLPSFEFSFGSSAKEAAAPAAGKKSGGSLAGSRTLMIAALVVLILCGAVAAGGYVYLQKRKTQEYASNFVQAVYLVKAGSDRAFKACAKITADAKARPDFSLAPVSKEEMADMERLKADADRMLKTLSEPPKQFSTANAKLSAMHGTYSKAHALAVAPAGPLTPFADSAARLEGEFRQGVQEFKGSLPPELSEKLTQASAKFKKLREL